MFLFSLGGSGQHAIMRWLCKQIEPAVYYNNCIIGNNEIKTQNIVAEFEEGNATQTRYNKCIFKDEWNLIIFNFINKSPEYCWHLETFFRQKCTFSIVVRDHYNFIASRFSKGIKKNLNTIIKTWEKHINLCLNPPKNLIDINYNMWHSNEKYRRDLCKRLKLPFTDNGLEDEPFIGRTKFKDKDYDNRWKQYNDNKHYKDIVSNPVLINLTKAYFGFTIE